MKNNCSIRTSSHIYQSIEEYDECLRNLNASAIQLSKGEFQGESTILCMGDAVIATMKAKVKHMITCQLDSYIAFTFPIDNIPFYSDQRWMNRESNFYMSPGNNEFTAIYQENFKHLVTTISHSSLELYLGKEKSAELIASISKYSVNFNSDGALLRFILNLFQYLSWQCKHNNESDLSPDSYLRLLILQIYEYICNPMATSFASNSNYSKIISRTIEYITSSNKEINLDQLSSQIYSSKRSIQYSFSKVLNMSPLQFITAIKLNRIRLELKLADPLQTNINDIIKKYKISNLSRFKHDYLDFYDETPDETFNYLKAG